MAARYPFVESGAAGTVSRVAGAGSFFLPSPPKNLSTAEPAAFLRLSRVACSRCSAETLVLSAASPRRCCSACVAAAFASPSSLARC